MRLLLDMDGPLAAFDLAFWDCCNVAGFVFDVASPAEQRHRFFSDHIPRRQRAEARAMVAAPGWFAGLPVTAGAVGGVAELEADGVELWVCSKPLDASPTCRDEKAAWLAEHFPTLADRLILSPDKSLVKADVLLDDAPHPSWIQRAEWRPVIFSAPYNGIGSKWADLPHWTWGEDWYWRFWGERP